MLYSASMDMDTLGNANTSGTSINVNATQVELPAWRMPISTIVSSSLRGRQYANLNASPVNSSSEINNSNQICNVYQLTGSIADDKSGIIGSSRQDIEMQQNINSNHCNLNNSSVCIDSMLLNEEDPAISNSLKITNEDDSQTVIQILLPCMVCSRTFSPEALERHAKVCTKVNIRSPHKPTRGTFDISEKRKKGTKLEDFIPPPPTLDALIDTRFGFSRGSRCRTSLRGTPCTTRSNMDPSHGVSSASNRRERSVSQNRERNISTSRTAVHLVPLSPPPQPYYLHNSQNEYPYDTNSEFGSNNSEEMNNALNLPSYAKPIAPTDLCPYCDRRFGIKSYDRHVEFCKELFERKRYETQPTPKEKEEALERQELRTKYKPMKGSSSCTSLRSMSPGKDFACLALKLFGGLRRTEGTSNLYFNQIKNNLKKSNESIANSCYGDYTRGYRRTSPSPVRSSGTSSAAAANQLNNLLSKSSYQQQQQLQRCRNYGYPMQQQGSHLPLPMRTNTSDNIPKMTKSSDNLTSQGNSFAHVPSSGYGQSSSVNISNNFSRHSRSRNSLHKNFFRAKRAEPDGTDSSTLSPIPKSPLITSQTNFYSKGIRSSTSALELSDSHNHSSEMGMDQMLENTRSTGTSALSADPNYDPYEKAAKQLEELLKSTPVKSNKRSSRRTGLEKAFESVGVTSKTSAAEKSRLVRVPTLDNSESFGQDSYSLENVISKFGNRRDKDENCHTTGMARFGLGNGSPMIMTPNIDDSYWDQILRKGGTEYGNNSNSNNNNLEVSDTTGGTSDITKPRAMSNTNSADAAFSRSELNGAEFEVLESIASLGSLVSNKHINEASHHSNQLEKPISMDMHRRHDPPSVSADQRQTVVDSSPEVLGRQQPQGNGTTLAKYCHECGTSYPSVVAKFCPECGEKRVRKN